MVGEICGDESKISFQSEDEDDSKDSIMNGRMLRVLSMHCDNSIRLSLGFDESHPIEKLEILVCVHIICDRNMQVHVNIVYAEHGLCTISTEKLLAPPFNRF